MRVLFLSLSFGIEITNLLPSPPVSSLSHFFSKLLEKHTELELETVRAIDKSSLSPTHSLCLFETLHENDQESFLAHRRVQRWTRGIDLFSLGLLLFSINHSGHWSLCNILRPDKLFKQPSTDVAHTGSESDCFMFHLDSSGAYHNSDQMHTKFFDYLRWEFLAKRCGGNMEHPDFIDYKKARMPLLVKSDKKVVPQQRNGTDCGLYLVKFAEAMVTNQTALRACRISDIAGFLRSALPESAFSQLLIDGRRTELKATVDHLHEVSYHASLHSQQFCAITPFFSPLSPPN